MKQVTLAFVICSIFLTSIAISQKSDSNQTEIKSQLIRSPRQSANSDAEKPDEVSEPKKGLITRAVVQQNNTGQTVRMVGNVAVKGAKNAADAADKFLRENAGKFGIEPLFRSKGAGNGLRVKEEIESLTGTHIIYNQFYENLPVFDEEIKVSVNKKLQIMNASSNVVTLKATRGFDRGEGNQAAAIEAALKAVNGKIHPKLQPVAEAGMLRRSAGDPTKVFRVNFQTVQPTGAWEVLVNAKDNEIISLKNAAIYAAGKGKVFNPNPVISSGKYDFTDNNDADSPFLTKQLVSVPLLYLDGKGKLNGKFANTSLTWTFERATSRNLTFNFTRSDDRFEEVMAYYWVTEGTLYLKKLGYPNLLNRSIPIDVNYLAKDDLGKLVEDYNAFYSPWNKGLNFGTGGVDTAEDATVILHEYGHALLDAQSPGMLRGGGEARAIHEAFGDYWAASFFAKLNQQKSVWNVYLGSWWAIGIPTEWVNCFQPGSAPCLRRLDTPKHYPEDLDPDMEEHNNGEIWSACLWQIWLQLGKTNADKLILESNFRLPRNAKFKDAANAIIATNRDLNKGTNETALRKIFVDKGILSADQ